VAWHMGGWQSLQDCCAAFYFWWVPPIHGWPSTSTCQSVGMHSFISIVMLAFFWEIE
jgi:hypothetical protein